MLKVYGGIDKRSKKAIHEFTVKMNVTSLQTMSYSPLKKLSVLYIIYMVKSYVPPGQ